MEINSSRSAILKALCAVIFWGASFVATKLALQYVDPNTLVWLRFSMGILVLGAAVGLSRQFSLPQGKDWAYFALLGFIGITFHQWLQSTGLVTAEATTTGWIIASTPIFIALMGYLVLKERLAGLQWAGILLATLGVLLVVTKGDLSSLVAGRFGAPGDFLVLLSAPNWAVFSILSRHGLKQYPATRMMFFVMGFGWIFTSLLFITGSGIEQISAISWDGWLAIGFLGIFCSGIAYIFWYDALQLLPVAQTGAFLYLEPVVTVIVAALLLREALQLAALLGGITILVGVWMVNRPQPLVASVEEKA